MRVNSFAAKMGLMSFRLIFVLLLIIAVFPVFSTVRAQSAAADVHVEATIDRPQIELGSSAQFMITVYGAQNVPPVNIGPAAVVRE